MYPLKIASTEITNNFVINSNTNTICARSTKVCARVIHLHTELLIFVLIINIQ